MADFSDLLESYYEEIDPDKRKKILDEYLAAAGDSDPAAAYRKALYEYRFVDPADPQRKLDRFMLAFLDFLYLYRSSRVLPGRYVRESTRILCLLKPLTWRYETRQGDILIPARRTATIENSSASPLPSPRRRKNSAVSMSGACPTALRSAWTSKKRWTSSAGR